MPFGFGGGRGRGRGGGRGGRGFGGGRRRGWFGPPGRPNNCICPNCGTITAHRLGLPCFHTKCPNCGSQMTRQFL